MDVKTEKAPMVAALLAVFWALGAPAAVEASLPLDAPSSVFKTADPFATAPQLDLPSLTEQLRAVEERRAAASDCVALCELAAGIEARPFGPAVSVLPNRSEDAWGNYRFTSELETSHNRFGFTGHYWDKEASLYYAKARYYDPFTARFTQADSFLGTIDNPPSIHRYQYAHANPTRYVDLSGHCVGLVDLCDQAVAWAVDKTRSVNFAGSYASSDAGKALNFALHAGIEFGGNAAALPGSIRRGIGSLFSPGARGDGGFEGLARTDQIAALKQAQASESLWEKGYLTAGALASQPAVVLEEGVLEPIVQVPTYARNVGTASYKAYDAASRGEYAEAAIQSFEAVRDGSAAFGTLGGIATGGSALVERAQPATAGLATLGRLEPQQQVSQFIGPRIGNSGLVTSQEFADAAFNRYQTAVEAGYSRAVTAESRGLLTGNANTRIGDFVDRFTAQQFRNWLGAEGIAEGPNAMVQMNRWLRDPSGSGLYVRPDIRILAARRIFDATVSFKPPSSTQLSRFAAFSNGDRVTIVRPEAVGGSYSIR